MSSQSNQAPPETIAATPKPEDDENVIRPLKNADLSRGHRVFAVLVLVAMATLIVGTIVVDAMGWKSESELQKIDLWSVPGSEEIFDGRAAIEFGEKLRNVSRTRQEGAYLWANFLARAFGHFHKSVVSGKGEWLFIKNRLGTRLQDNAKTAIDLKASAAVMACLDRRLAQYGTKLTLMLLPRKGLVCESLLDGVSLEGGQMYRLFTKELRREGIECPDLLTPLLPNPEEVWLSRNSHWSEEGTLRACKAAAEETGVLLVKEQRPSTVRRLPAVQGEDIAQAGLLVRRREGFFNVDKERPTTKLQFLNPEGQVIGRGSFRRRESAPNVLVGTSFSKSFPTAASLAHYTGLDILDRSVGSIGPVIPLGDFLRTPRVKQGKVKRLFWEVPAHFAFSQVDPMHRVYSLPNALADLPPRHLTPIGGLGEAYDPGADIKLSFHEAALARGVLAMSPEHLLTSGDGVVTLKFERRAAAKIVFRYLLPEVYWHVNAIWKSSRQEISLPAIAAGPTRNLNLFMQGKPKVGPLGPIKGISLCIDGKVDWKKARGPDAVVTDPGTGVHSAVWRGELTWDKLRSLVVHRPDSKAPWGLRLLRIGVITPDGKPGILVEEDGDLPVPTLSVLSAGKFTGQKIAAIAIQAKGQRAELETLRLAWAHSR